LLVVHLRKLYPLGSRDTPMARDSGRLVHFGIGLIVGLTAVAAAMLTRKFRVAAAVGRGHPLKHRVLALAASAYS
jgi:hypothetical protein